ncbi:MAG: sulfotransferase family protein [Parvularcula sp.]
MSKQTPAFSVFECSPPTANYITHRSPKSKCIFFEVPKTGCTTIKRVLQLAENPALRSMQLGEVHDRAKSPLQNISASPDLFLAELKNPDVLKFSFVRNPYTRALSGYLDKIIANDWEWSRRAASFGREIDDKPTFVEFLRFVDQQPPKDRDVHWTEQHLLVGSTDLRLGFIGRFENFRDDFQIICAALDLCVPFGELRSGRSHATNASAKLREFYDGQAINLVQKIYGGDFERFGYGLDPFLV